jgi:N6-L-threonylcarbamoyladenine synthase
VLVLGIETSCDETSAAVVEDGRCVRSNAVSSQIELHAPYGGVVPEVASRQHVRAINLVIERALSDAGIALEELDLVAATQGPGLAGALLVGVNFGRGLALGLGKPFAPVNHLEGHLHSVWLTCQCPGPPAPRLPLLALIVSGGHTELVLMRDHGDYGVVGRTLDDAAGEAFDKVARLLGLPYPGGPAIQAAASEARDPVRVPRAWLPDTHDFSFSGVKTAVLHLAYAAAHGRSPDEIRGQALPQADIAEALSREQVANLAAGFQQSVVDVLATKLAQAAEQLNPASVAVVGGVAANKALRSRVQEVIQQPLYVSTPEFSTDNAAMIASAAYYVPRQAETDDIDVLPSLGLMVSPHSERVRSKA